jgi:hypothetical protein
VVHLEEPEAPLAVDDHVGPQDLDPEAVGPEAPHAAGLGQGLGQGPGEVAEAPLDPRDEGRAEGGAVRAGELPRPGEAA